MKVLLVNPPVPDFKVWVREGRCQQFDIWGAPFPPISLAYIAGQLKRTAEFLIIDSGPEKLNLENTLARIQNFSPDLMIVATATPTISTDLNWFVKAVKEKLSNIKIAAIGIHVSALHKETLQDFSFLDFVIRQEPEITAKHLIKTLISRGDLSQVEGLDFRRGNKIIINSPRDFIENLDDLSLPCWTGVNFNNYRMPIRNKPFNLIYITRGCPFSCKFCNACAYTGKKIRKRSPEKVVEEIETNVKNGICDFLFWTEFITLDREYLLKLVDLIKNRNLGKKIHWVSNSRVDFADYELFKKIAEVGCWQIAFGLEFGNNDILKLANKGGNSTIEQGRKAIELANKAGIVTDGHFMLGYPGETEKTMQDTIDFACSLPLTFAHFYAATPFPGSQLYEEALKNQWIANPDWKNVSQSVANINTSLLKNEIVQKYISRAYRRFYLRPQIIYRIGCIAKSPLEFLNVIRFGIQFVYSVFKG